MNYNTEMIIRIGILFAVLLNTVMLKILFKSKNIILQDILVPDWILL